MDNAPICSFDIETYRQGGGFPTGRDEYDRMFMLSLVFKNPNGDLEKYLLTLLKGTEYWNRGNDYLIETFNNEKEIIERMCELIRQKKPSMVVGHNISGYDLPFMRYKMKGGKFPSMVEGEPDAPLKEISKGSFGKSSYIPRGSLPFVDTMVFARKRYPNLMNHKLDTVGGHFLGRGKDPITLGEIREAYSTEDPLTCSKVAKYCIEDSTLCCDLVEKMEVSPGDIPEEFMSIH